MKTIVLQPEPKNEIPLSELDFFTKYIAMHDNCIVYLLMRHNLDEGMTHSFYPLNQLFGKNLFYAAFAENCVQNAINDGYDVKCFDTFKELIEFYSLHLYE